MVQKNLVRKRFGHKKNHNLINIIFRPKLFFGQNLFRTRFFWTNIFLSNFFWTTFFWTNLFLDWYLFWQKPNQTYQTKLTKPDLQNQTNQTKPAQTHQHKYKKPYLRHPTFQRDKIAAPKVNSLAKLEDPSHISQLKILLKLSKSKLVLSLAQLSPSL